jgi:hypothetical protein
MCEGFHGERENVFGGAIARQHCITLVRIKSTYSGKQKFRDIHSFLVFHFESKAEAISAQSWRDTSNYL